YSSMIYLSSEIGHGGLIDTIAFYVTNDPSNYQMLNQRVYIIETSASAHSSSDFPDTTSMQRVFHGELTFNGNGWHKIALQTPYNYSGTGNLQIVWLNYDGSYVSDYPEFKTTAVTGNRGLYKHQDPSFPTSSGTYDTYVPNLYIAISGCNSNIVPVTAYVIYPPYELAVEELIAPAAGECIETNTNVTVRLKNYGTDAIPAGVDLTCVLNGTDTINGTTTEQILPNSTIDFTFPAFLTIPFIGGHASVELEVYHNNPAYSTITNNDTLLVDVNLMQKPDNPIVASQTINYGEMATLTASSPSGVPIQWYSDPLGQNILHVGDTYITPRIYSNTVYYLSSVSSGDVIVGDMNSTTTSYYIPFYGFYDYGYSSMIYLSSEIGQGGLIDTIAFYVTNSPTNYLMLDQRVYITETSAAAHSSSDFPDTTSMQRVFKGDMTFDGTGWHKVALQTPFNYSGTNNLQIVWLNYDGDYVSGYPYFKTTNVTGNRGLYKYQDNSFPTTSGTTVTYVPNLYVSISGCSSDIVSDTVYVENIPAVDVGVVEITKPNTGIELTDEEEVKVIIKNFTPTDLNNATFDVVYKVDNQPAVVEQFTGTILAHDTASFIFTQPADLSIIGNTYTMMAYTDHDLDGFRLNDTLQKSITNNPLEYCTSTATSTGDEDICRFMLADLDNTSGYSSAQYTDFTDLPAPVLFIGQDYPLELEVCDNPSYYYAGYARVFIDWNHDGEYQVPDEVVFESYYPAQASTLLTDSITVPTDAYIGYTGMRVIVREGSILPDPCGTYSYGETEDYLVLVLPRKAIDAGISAANVGYAQYNGTTTTAEVKVRNYGYNPLTNFDIIAKKDAQVISTTPWSGNLLPDSSIIFNIPNLPVDSGLNNVCFTVQTLNDSVPQNDTRCAQYFGLPSVVLFEDDMEPTTLLTADTTGMWEHGEPQGTLIDQAYSAPNVWMTKLAEPYPNDTIGYLEFPVQNFSGVTDPYLSFYYWVESESGKDGAYIEYSLNNGQTWLTLGGIDDPDGYHWYTDYLSNGKPGYSGSSNGWVGAFIKMSALSNKTNVRLRIGFVSDATVNADGFAIDNIVISAYNVPNNVALAEIVTPTSPTTTGSTQTVKVKIANVGTNVVNNVPVSYKIEDGTAVNGTYSGSINPGDTVEYTFTQTYLAPHIDYTLCAYTRYPSDIVRINDTLCMNIQSLPADYDIGVVEIISPSDSTPIGQQIAVTIAVKNFGLNPVSNVPVRYQLNYANDRNDVISQTINPGDTIHFTFTQQYNGPTMQYVLCAETQLSNDMYPNNDAICEVLGTYVVGIEDILDENDGIVLYPNPSTGELNVLLETTKASEGTLIIRNPLGELVYSENISVNAGRNELRLDLTNQAAGLYHCTVMLGDKVYNRVISIQK
ncbi:MAG: hypothetical protein PWQ14_317, partial [Rikenellaceae bacterium]|nr:hypothetical protein [Rikenellaceae bacterium]